MRCAFAAIRFKAIGTTKSIRAAEMKFGSLLFYNALSPQVLMKLLTTGIQTQQENDLQNQNTEQ